MKIDWFNIAAETAKSGHALFGPSALPRIMRCPGSVKAGIVAEAKNASSEFAEEGTRAHRLAEILLYDLQTNTEARATDYRDVYIDDPVDGTFTPDEEMMDAVQQYVDWCMELPGTHFIESKVDLSPRMPIEHQFGTSDHGAIHQRTLYVTDLKYGKGVQVYAEQNEQALAYALGMYDDLSWGYEIDRVVIRIAQPRLHHFDVWETDVATLLEFAQRMHTAVLTAVGKNPPTTAGEKQCQFCPVRGKCATQLKAVQDAIAGDFDSFDTEQPVRILSAEEIAKAIPLAETAKKWAGHIQSTAMSMLAQDPAAIPGYKIVESTTRRAWLNPDKAEVWLQKQGLRENQIIERKLTSPAKAEKLLSRAQKKEFAEVNKDEKSRLVHKPPGKPALAPVTDKRPIYARVNLSEFDEFEEEDAE